MAVYRGWGIPASAIFRIDIVSLIAVLISAAGATVVIGFLYASPLVIIGVGGDGATQIHLR